MDTRQLSASNGVSSFDGVKRLVTLLGSRRRLDLLLLLARGPTDVTTLARRLRINRSYVSRILGQLARAELVSKRREKRECIYRLTEHVVVTRGKDSFALSLSLPDHTNVALYPAGASAVAPMNSSTAGEEPRRSNDNDWVRRSSRRSVSDSRKTGAED